MRLLSSATSSRCGNTSFASSHLPSISLGSLGNMVIMDRRPSGKAAVLSFPETERLSSANLMAVPMYLQHGFTSICTASALAETGALRYMMEHERWSLRSLCEGLKLQPGYTKSCVHLLVSLDLLVDEGGGGYRRGRDFDDFVRLPFESIEKYLSYDFAKVFDQNVNAFFAQIDLTGPKLPRIQLLLESFYLAPIVIYLRMYVQGTSEAFKTTHLRLDESSLGPSVLAIFQGLGWCADNTSKLTYMGTYVLSTALNAGVPISYYPMFQELPKILMGDGSIFAAQEADGHEVHVDRVLNVIASGAQHKRFFEHMCNGVFNRVFDDQPLEDQPAAVADMGCGDGRLLLTLYEYVRDHTKRGKHLDKFPFTVIGIDFNYESLDVTKETLGSRNIPFEVQWGDIGDPDAAMDELEKRGFPRDSVLHVRTFIDHDRPYIAPKRPGDDYAMYAHGVYNKNDGTIIDPSTMLQSLVEHLERWSDAVGVHGMCILEAGQGPRQVGRAGVRGDARPHPRRLRGRRRGLVAPRRRRRGAPQLPALLRARPLGERERDLRRRPRGALQGVPEDRRRVLRGLRLHGQRGPRPGPGAPRGRGRQGPGRRRQLVARGRRQRRQGRLRDLRRRRAAVEPLQAPLTVRRGS